MNFSALKGFKECVFQGVKGRTWLSRVTSFNWDSSVEKMYCALDAPKKTCLYEQDPYILLSEKEWCFYSKLQSNVRVKVMPVVTGCHLRFEQYQHWLSQLRNCCYKTSSLPLWVHYVYV